ncbi:MAG: hypothetical protein ABFC96_10200, partial [Thermoguttaceae bacterium]
MKKSMLAMTVILTIVSSLGTNTRTASAAEQLMSGIDLSCMDKNVRPQDDLFRAVNGDWLGKTDIPADRSAYGVFIMLAERTEKDLRQIIETCANAKDNSPGSERQKIGDLFASYMDEDRAEQLGITPIAGMLASIDQINSKAELIKSLAQFERSGVTGPVACYVSTDAKKSDRNVLYVFQDGLGLPERYYYWDAKFKAKLAA